MALFHRQYQLNSHWLGSPFFVFQSPKCGTWYLVPATILVSPPSRLQELIWYFCVTSTGCWTLIAQSEPDTWHPASLNSCVSVQSTIVIDHWTWQDQRARTHVDRDTGGDAPVCSPVCLCVAWSRQAPRSIACFNPPVLSGQAWYCGCFTGLWTGPSTHGAQK